LLEIISRKNEEMKPGRNNEDPWAMIYRRKEARQDLESPSVWAGKYPSDDKLQI
jgi:hypothetical protein